MIPKYVLKMTNEYQPYLEKIGEYKIPSLFSSVNALYINIKKKTDILQYQEEYSYMIGMVNCRMVGLFELSHGTCDESHTSIRSICTRLLLLGCNYCILFHIHPCDNCIPSQDDKINYKQIKTGCDIMQIGIVDDLVFTKKSYNSFAVD